MASTIQSVQEGLRQSYDVCYQRISEIVNSPNATKLKDNMHLISKIALTAIGVLIMGYGAMVGMGIAIKGFCFFAAKIAACESSLAALAWILTTVIAAKIIIVTGALVGTVIAIPGKALYDLGTSGNTFRALYHDRSTLL